MKKTFKTMLALMAGAVAFTACSNDDITENINEQKTSALKPMTFTASVEAQDGASRATIDGLDIKWVDGDKISIFDGGDVDADGNFAREFTLTDGFGTFEGNAAAGAEVYYALYPYTASLIVDRVPTEEEAMTAGGVEKYVIDIWKQFIKWGDDGAVWDDMNDYGISEENKAFIIDFLLNQKRILKSGPQRNGNQFEDVVLPAEQTVAEGQCIDPKAMLMIGESDDAKSLQFKNVCAYVKVTPQFACTSISLESKGTESLAGTVTLDYNSATPTANVTANGTNKVTLSGAIAANTTYYIAVLPATLSSGFSIRFVTTDAIYKKSTNNTLTLARNKVINLGSFDTSDLTLVPTTGTAKATIGGETVDVPWVQLWEDGPKFAEYNVGAASATEYGGYYQWGSSIDRDPNTDYKEGTESLTGDDDTATALWGSNWRMPTITELLALLDNCKCTWIENYNGTSVCGLLCQGKEGTVFASNSVFLPAGGSWDQYWNEPWDENLYGEYWSSTPDGSNYAVIMDFNPYFDYESFEHDYRQDRYDGYSVRAVLK